MKTIDEFRSSEYDPVIGTTVISHRPRTKLGLTLGEYTVGKLVEYCQQNKKELTSERAFLHTGIDTNTLKECLDSLIDKKLVEWPENLLYPVLLDKWHDVHRSTVDIQFEKFWEKEYEIRWGGSKAAAKEKFDLLIIQIDFAYLMAQKRAYFKYLCLPENDWRHVMGGAVFLNKATKRYAEPWATYLKEAGKKRRPVDEVKAENRRKLSLEERKNLFK